MTDGWIAGLLDEITAEHDGGVAIGDDGDQVVAGMAAPWMGDRHRRSAEIEFGLVDGLSGGRSAATALATSSGSAP